jgi:serine/threonine-protein kinase
MSGELAQPGQIIDGKYRIVRLLGMGGMGSVYEGENLRIKRKVAIKMLHGSVSDQPEVIARFEREAQAAALVGSEHICEVLDLGELADHTRFMVMEYLEGETLSNVIKRAGRLKPAQSIPILSQILEALGAAHQAGIIHRDLKPDNVFILPQRGGIQNFVKILDFGVSKFSQASGESMNVTRAGAVVGTPYYMSPEQARGSSAIDQRTDIYAIGVLLYQATTGQVPYQAETFNELLFKIVLEVAPPPQTYVPDLDPEFASIIMRAMAREPEQRFQSCMAFRNALAQYQARLNPLPAYNMPAFRDEDPAGTLVLASPMDNAPVAQQPPMNPMGPPRPLSAGSWPGMQPAPMHASQPGVPGIQFNASAPGFAPSPVQSGAQWAAASIPGVQAPVTNTANSWGNASSPSNTVPKKTGSGMLLGVVGGAALLGIGGAIAGVVLLGKSDQGAASTPAPTPTTQVTATATTAPPATATAAVTATASAAETATAAPAATDKPAASASADAAPSATAAKVPGPMPIVAPKAPGGPPKGGGATAPKGPKAGPKAGGNDLGY